MPDAVYLTIYKVSDIIHILQVEKLRQGRLNWLIKICILSNSFIVQEKQYEIISIFWQLYVDWNF